MAMTKEDQKESAARIMAKCGPLNQEELATLMRVESGRIPDLDTFGKLCKWLGEDPREFLGLDALERRASPESEPVAIFAGHFRSDQTPKKATVEALARMMLLASRSQPKTPDEGS